MTRTTMTTTEVVEVDETYTQCDSCGHEITDDQPSERFESSQAGYGHLDFHDECLDELGALTHPPTGVTWGASNEYVIVAMDSLDLAAWSIGAGLLVVAAGLAVEGVFLIAAFAVVLGVLGLGVGWSFGREQAATAIVEYEDKLQRWVG